jgi:hypothetical protein
MAQFTSEVHSERAQQLSQSGYDPCDAKYGAAGCSLIKQQSLNTLIDRELIREYAAKHHITVAAADVQRNWKQIFKSRFNGQQAVLDAFLKRTGQTEADLRASLKNTQLEQIVLGTVTQSMPTIVPAIRVARLVAADKAELQIVRNLLRKGTAFVKVAAYLRKNSPKGCGQSTQQCGEIGWVPLAFVPSYIGQLKTAPAGSLVGPLRQAVGQQVEYQLYKVEARATQYQMTPSQTYHMRQIVFEQWLQKQQAKAQVKRYVTI